MSLACTFRPVNDGSGTWWPSTVWVRHLNGTSTATSVRPRKPPSGSRNALALSDADPEWMTNTPLTCQRPWASSHLRPILASSTVPYGGGFPGGVYLPVLTPITPAGENVPSSVDTPSVLLATIFALNAVG